MSSYYVVNGPELKCLFFLSFFLNLSIASLIHHEQTMHASTEPPKQRSYPAYCDVSPALGPGSTKIVPYAQHSVTSYINGQLHVERAVPNYAAQSAGNKPYLLPKPPAAAPPIKVEGGVTPNAAGNAVPNKVIVSQSTKPVVHNKQAPSVKHVMTKGGVHPQFIDPPEEFQFLSNKHSR